MRKKKSIIRIFACILLISFLSAFDAFPVMAEGRLPVQSIKAVETEKIIDSIGSVSLSKIKPYGYSNYRDEIIIVAANETSDRTSTSSVQKKDHDFCGNFWQIHFGGYRWAWWALAGAGLIAIHAN